MATILERAVKQFGTTENFLVAGYILPDGSLLDFEGGDGGGYIRGMDHRDVQQLYRDVEGTDAMVRFMRAGAIRISIHGPRSDYWGLVNVATIPTREQWVRIRELATLAHSGTFEVLHRTTGTAPVASRTWARGELHEDLPSIEAMVEAHLTVEGSAKVRRKTKHEHTVAEKVRGLSAWGWKGVLGVSDIRKVLKLTWSDNEIIERELDFEVDHKFRASGGRVIKRGSLPSGAPGWFWE